MLQKERENHTAVLPKVRLKPSQLKQLHSDAARRGYSKKIGTYIRGLLFGAKLKEDQPGMSMNDVIRNMADLCQIQQAQTLQEAKEHAERIRERHMHVIRS